MTLSPHADFIIASYAITAFVVAAMIAWVVLDHSSLRRMLGGLEDQGVMRRSRQKE